MSSKTGVELIAAVVGEAWWGAVAGGVGEAPEDWICCERALDLRLLSFLVRSLPHGTLFLMMRWECCMQLLDRGLFSLLNCEKLLFFKRMT